MRNLYPSEHGNAGFLSAKSALRNDKERGCAVANELIYNAPMRRDSLLAVYQRLRAHYGSQEWWPRDTQFEIIVGAILTQNTAWRNVEIALANLKHAHALNPARMRALRTPTLARLIRPAGYYNQKARALKAFLDFLFTQYGGRLARMKRAEGETLRTELLTVRGIGHETADAILLYVCNYPTFIADAYARRIFARIGWCRANAGYEELRRIVDALLPPDAEMLNEYHALLVRLGKDICLKRAPRCGVCPLLALCARRGVRVDV